MSTLLKLQRDITGENSFGLPISTDKYSMLLTTNTEQHFNSPISSDALNSTYFLAVFSATPGAGVWIAFDGNTAVIPGGAVSTTNSELLPAARVVKGGSQISLITSSVASVEMGVIFYALSKQS